MKLESVIQEWMVQLAGGDGRVGNSDLYSVVRYDDSSLSREMKNEVERYGLEGGLGPSRHRSAREACRVLKSLVEPRFKSANRNISLDPGKVLKPDLILEDEISSAFVIVELKRSRKTAREFATELLAYANCLSEQYPGSQVFLVAISTSWAPLEQHAFAQLAHYEIPTLALEYREESAYERTPTLLVRDDLLPIADVRPFSPDALLADTKVFLLPDDWRIPPQVERWCNRIEHAVTALVREAERGRASGFVVVWYCPRERSSQSQVRLFVSMAVRNSFRPQEIPEFKTEQEAEDFAWSNTFTELIDDTAVRLLLDLEVGQNILSYSSESEGIWANLEARLANEGAHILRFDAFGEIGDQVSTWRTQQRYALAPVVADITSLPTWHPLTWLSALESLIDTSEQDEGDPLAWHAFRCGENVGRFRSANFGQRDARHFGWATTQARFASTWCEFFASSYEAPALFAQVIGNTLRCGLPRCDLAVEFASKRLAECGELARYCFALGYHVGSGCDNVEYLVKSRYGLRKSGIRLPDQLDAKVDEVERSFSYLFTSP
ncbi:MULTISPECIES: hypothetical protein [Burkholderia cepacia complex]|uniref:Uncharacterized protein n=1 Tax=Burkholderia ubonensis TaxID=101571 RepID=A0A1B4LFL0_9BURK|nr:MULTISPECIES: hypothetical protein [Burkholderia cepacia complex]AOJ75931.1 hypothetical protein WJ35_13255 [Burkholderia ubonensis]CAG9190215.1 conserved hypothetical protein [Burkholderia vietnamiensis]